MNETRKKLCIGILVFMNMHKILEAAWYEKITADGEKKIQHTIPRLKRIPESLLTNEVYPANSGLEELLMAVPDKRAALLLDRIMVALQKAVDDGKDVKMKSFYPEFGIINNCIYVFDFQSSLQRRGQEKGKVYWRCYFNAVTCF
ncbi:hypothetical protein V9T40_008399 [Parthenolecanium corni]|uniref:Uncharacterized protein n=1 Tax=Parthenolecanium corni TaxID=536013 RepID=A0AAN9TN25_9HEMI